MKRLANFIPNMTNVTVWKHIHHTKHVSSLICQDKINGSNFSTPEEEHVKMTTTDNDLLPPLLSQSGDMLSNRLHP